MQQKARVKKDETRKPTAEGTISPVHALNNMDLEVYATSIIFYVDAQLALHLFPDIAKGRKTGEDVNKRPYLFPC